MIKFKMHTNHSSPFHVHVERPTLTVEDVKELIQEELENIEIDSGLTQDEVKEIVATETEGKVDKTTLAGIGSVDNAGLVYTPKGSWNGIKANNGVLTIIPASNSQIDGKTNVYNAITPSNLDYAVRSVVGEDFADHEKRIENLESTLLTYVEDSTEAYEKAVPVGAAPNAIINSLGGKTIASKNYFNPQLVSNAMDDKYNITVPILSDGGIVITEIPDLPTEIYVKVTLYPGTYYISTNATYPIVFDDWTSITTITEKTEVNILLQIDDTMEGAPVCVMLSKDAELLYEPYFEGLRDAPVTNCTSYNIQKEVIDTYTIPLQIQEIDGYGKKYTTLDFDNKIFTDNGEEIILTGQEPFVRTYLASQNTVYVQNILDYVCNNQDYVCTDSVKTTSLYEAGNIQVGYGNKSLRWVGILDLWGYTSSWADKAAPTHEEISSAITAFKAELASRYAAGHPVTIRYELPEGNATETDVSPYLTDYDDFKDFKVQAGGIIIPENTYKYAVPTTLTYVKRRA